MRCWQKGRFYLRNGRIPHPRGQKLLRRGLRSSSQGSPYSNVEMMFFLAWKRHIRGRFSCDRSISSIWRSQELIRRSRQGSPYSNVEMMFFLAWKRHIRGRFSCDRSISMVRRSKVAQEGSPTTEFPGPVQTGVKRRFLWSKSVTFEVTSRVSGRYRWFSGYLLQRGINCCSVKLILT